MLPSIELRTVVLDCRDAHELGAFYSRLLGWPVACEEADWVLLRSPVPGGAGLAFQAEPDYAPPVWPEVSGKPQKMEHLDFRVQDLDAACAHALACGARLSPNQYLKGVRVFFDPAGHPFCLFTDA